MEMNKSDSERLREISMFHEMYTEDQVFLRRIADTIERKAVSDDIIQAIGKVIEGFDKNVFIRSIDGDAEPGWAAKLLPYIKALGVLVSFHDNQTNPIQVLNEYNEAKKLQDERDHYKALMEYWKKRCEASEKVIDKMYGHFKFKASKDTLSEMEAAMDHLDAIKVNEPK